MLFEARNRLIWVHHGPPGSQVLARLQRRQQQRSSETHWHVVTWFELLALLAVRIASPASKGYLDSYHVQCEA